MRPINTELRQLSTMPDPCWEWTKHRSDRGYGIIKVKGKNQYIHRLFYRLFVGALNAHQVVIHRCDNPPCCNPSHLRAGTSADNIADCKAKLRHAFGASQFNAILTDEEVIRMRIEYASGTTSQPKLAAKYGVCRSTARAALYGQTWSHLAGALCPRTR